MKSFANGVSFMMVSSAQPSSHTAIAGFEVRGAASHIVFWPCAAC